MMVFDVVFESVVLSKVSHVRHFTVGEGGLPGGGMITKGSACDSSESLS